MKHPVEKPFVAKVKIQETDCFTCFGGSYVLKELLDVASVELVFKDMGEKEIQRFLEINGLTSQKGGLVFDVITDSVLHGSLDKYGTTELHLFNDAGKELLAFPLKSELATKKVVEIQSLGRELMKKNRPQLDLKYAVGFCELSVSDSYFLVTTRSMNCSEVFDKDGNPLFYIDVMQIDPLEIYPEMKTYAKYTTSLKEMGMFACRMENAQMVGNRVLMKVYVPYITVRNDSIVQEVKPCIVSFSENGGIWSKQVVFDSAELQIEAMGKAKDGKDYYGISKDHDELGGFIYKKMLLTFADESLQIVENKKMNVPDFEVIPSFAYEAKVKDGLFSLGMTDFLYDLEHDVVYMLPVNCNPQLIGELTSGVSVSIDGQVIDWSYDGEALAAVCYDVRQKQCFYLYKENSSDGFNIKPLSFGPDLKCPPLCLVSPHVLYYLDSANKIQVMVL